MKMLLRSLIFFTVLVTINTQKPKMDFDVDYYFSSSLRSKDSCELVSNIYCQVHCGTKNAVCESGKCYCLTIKQATIENTIQKPVKEDTSFLYALRPTVRHHIAHFCPNLDVARTCIRKCMKQGLPSFCGKDHVCYCGHKYKNTDINTKTNAKDVYNQFKDLYTKYFGPDVRNKRNEKVGLS